MPGKRYLFTPGPTPVPPEVLAAAAAPVIHHRGPDFKELFARVIDRLKVVCRTTHDVLLFTASGTGAFESALVNLLSPGDRLLVVTAGEFGTKEEAVSMVTKAMAFIKEQGPDQAYPEITSRAGKFIDRDLYVVVYGLDGKVLAHGGNAKLVGSRVFMAS